MNAVRIIRMKKGLSQETIAEDLGITTSAFSKIERGETNVSFNRMLQIADALSISFYELLYAAERMEMNRGENMAAEAGEAYRSESIKARMDRLASENARLLAMLGAKDDVIRMLEPDDESNDDEKN